MKRCAFLTLANPADFVIDDELAYEPLRALGWDVEAVPWQQPDPAWGAFDAVVIRSPWDYQKDPDAFMGVLSEIERAGAPLYNRLALVQWNLRKTYLRDLKACGVPIVPTLWRDRLMPGDLPGLLDALGTAQAVVKPQVSANADGAFHLGRQEVCTRASEIETFYNDRALMAQPFVHAVVEEGEFSLFYFNGAHSHTILKTPAAGDFRVQEEHGGLIQTVRADEPLRAAGSAALRALGEAPLYARADFVRSNDGEAFWLMELELIDPSLYLRTDASAPQRFAEAIDERVATSRGHPL